MRFAVALFATLLINSAIAQERLVLPREVEELPKAHHCKAVSLAMHEPSVASALSSSNAFCIARKLSCRSIFRAASTPTASARAQPIGSTSQTGNTHVGATNVGVCGALIGLQ
jgi:hypothetical protein